MKKLFYHLVMTIVEINETVFTFSADNQQFTAFDAPDIMKGIQIITNLITTVNVGNVAF